jgi:hypothetical protein
MSRALFVDPTPVSMDDLSNISLSQAEMDTPNQVGGAAGIITVTIITCGGKLGAATVVTVGTAITTVISVEQEMPSMP